MLVLVLVLALALEISLCFIFVLFRLWVTISCVRLLAGRPVKLTGFLILALYDGGAVSVYILVNCGTGISNRATAWSTCCGHSKTPARSSSVS